MKTILLVLLVGLGLAASATFKVVAAFGQLAEERQVNIQAAMNLGESDEARETDAWFNR